MKYYWFLLFIAILSYGQSDGNTESNKLLGTTILTTSEKNMTARLVNGISLKRIIKSECQGSNEKINPDKSIISKLKMILLYPLTLLLTPTVVRVFWQKLKSPKTMY
jgi:hypothetical protein